MTDFDESIIVAAIQEDETVKQAVRDLAMLVINKSRYLIEHGNVTVQVQVMKNVMPAITKAMSIGSGDEKFEQMRIDFEAQMAEMRKLMGLDQEIPKDGY